MRLRYLGVLSLLAASTLAARADTLIGAQVDVQYETQIFGTTSQDFGTQTVTAGLTDTNSDGTASLTFGTDTITVTNLSPGAFSPFPFNGFDVSFLSGITINDVTIDPSSSSLFEPGSVLSFTGSSISLNLAGTCSACNGGESIILDVNPSTPSATPEPSSIALLGTGLLGVAGTLRKRLA